VDGVFERTGFDESKIYCKQGSYKYLQCYRGSKCSTDIWDAKQALVKLEDNVDTVTLIAKDPALVPRCPKCGSVAYHNANAGENWVSNLYERQRQKFVKWLNEVKDKRLVLIELGCGERLPFIRYPCENIAKSLPNAKLVRINLTEPIIPKGINGVEIPLGAVEGVSRIYNAL